jgi:hypothetical protein
MTNAWRASEMDRPRPGMMRTTSLREALLASLGREEIVELSSQGLARLAAKAIREPASLTLEEIRLLGGSVIIQATRG